LESLKLASDLDQALRAAPEKKEKAYGLAYIDFLDYFVSSDTFEEERRRLCRPRLIVEVEQEIRGRDRERLAEPNKGGGAIERRRRERRRV
jgi:hypothetical protein